MPHADFVHLRVHSAYSLSEGAIKVKELVGLCARMAMPAVAITDTGNLFGALEFSMAAAEAGVQPIIGCQLAITREDGERAPSGPAGAHTPDQLVLIAQNQEGYGNLMKLVSRSFLDTPSGLTSQVRLAELAGACAGLIALTGGPAGALGRLLAEGQGPAAAAMLNRLIQLFPGRLYIELMRHGLPIEQRIEGGLIDLAYQQSVPLVATNEAFFADESMYEAHDALLCIASGTFVAEPNRRRLTPEHRFKSAAEMRVLFSDLPEALDNTLVIARRCAFMPKKTNPILPAYPTAAGRDEAAELRARAAEGLERRLATAVFTPDMDEAARAAKAKPYRAQLAYELDMIVETKFTGYFLIVADFIQWAKSRGIAVGPGRGSAVGSVVAWSLTITDLDPLRWGLLFERLLSRERVSMPDIDVDFCQARRDEVLRYVQDKYGHDRVAQIITFGKLQARAVLRDVGRVLQLPYGQVDRICKLVPNNPANPVTLEQAIEGEPELQRQRDEDEAVARMLEIGRKLEGLYRHASTHAAGVVIGNRPLDEVVPLYRDPRSFMPVTQFNMKTVELAGLVKFDFLGLKTLTVIQHAVELIRASGKDIDIDHLPLDDARTYQMMARADVTGVFQMESAGVRDVLRRLKPDRFEDIIAVVALYRPGPMDNIPSYINRKHGLEKPDYLHPRIEHLLKETHGIMIYQEQVMQIAQALSGYSLGDADLLRRAMGKKIKAEMDAQRKTFVDGAVARGVGEATASHIFDQVARFAGYGFNKAHAAAYALVAYQTAWLKANHPVEFFAASMTLDLGNTDKLNVYRQELDRQKIPLLPPDINRSAVEFSVETIKSDGSEKRAIRYALAAVRKVGPQAMGAVIAERSAHGPFRALMEFADRMGRSAEGAKAINKLALENLVCAGAFDAIDGNRARVFAQIETVVRHAHATASERGSNQVSLFGDGLGVDNSTKREGKSAEMPDWTTLERLRREFEAIGFYLSAHPLDAYGASLERIDVVPASQILQRAKGSASTRVKLAGIVISRRERTSARTKSKYAFVQLTDRTGVFEVLVFSDLLAQSRDKLDSGQPLLVTVDARIEGDSARLAAQAIQSLDEALAGAAAGLKIFLRDDQPIRTLAGVIQREGKGGRAAKGQIRLVLDTDQREIEVALPGGYQVSAPLRAAIRAIPGVVEVRDI
ncbi:MAG: DNA polymerase III subunit alpha [Alphaproteobacteria bacterium]|nr:DNA polymerase III subunit alpha [Alphaproteobacteria bacterium]